jgi:hypothetical protein
MRCLITVIRQAMMSNIPFVGRRIVDKLRLVAGIGINVMATGAMLAEPIRFLGISL